MNKVLILASGGLDSAVLLKMYDALMYNVTVLSFDYGAYANKVERQKLIEQCNHMKNYTKLETLEIKIPWTHAKTMDVSEVLYIEMRNLIFLSYAVSLAEKENIPKVVIGVIKGAEGYPDTSEDFIARMNDLTLSSVGITVEAPLIGMDKSDVYNLAKSLGVKLRDTTSCFNPHLRTGDPCGKCLGCKEISQLIDRGRISDEDNPFIPR